MHEELIATPNASTGGCDVERLSAKRGTDSDVGLVNLNNPVIQTIIYLRVHSQTGMAPTTS